jgi:ubiquinone/menaquinone biosynthesis C-methylase UbiE
MRIRRLFRVGRKGIKTHPTSELSTTRIHDAVLKAVRSRAESEWRGDYLDIGSGKGKILEEIAREYSLRPFACDYTSTLMKTSGQRVDVANLNIEPLPYPDSQFALITCIETIEHLEHYRETVREMFRVLRPGGFVVITTPNILNLSSRIRYLVFGFPTLFGPLAVGETDIHNPRGHINPVGFFYLAHALLDAGFERIDFQIDKRQRRSIFYYALLFPFIRVGAALSFRRESRRFRTIDSHNIDLVRAMNSLELLLGRTLVVSARKPL